MKASGFFFKKSPELPEYLVPVLEHRQLPGGQLEVHGASLFGVIFLLIFFDFALLRYFVSPFGAVLCAVQRSPFHTRL